jgi:hypothetical protein
MLILSHSLFSVDKNLVAVGNEVLMMDRVSRTGKSASMSFDELLFSRLSRVALLLPLSRSGWRFGRNLHDQ